MRGHSTLAGRAGLRFGGSPASRRADDASGNRHGHQPLPPRAGENAKREPMMLVFASARGPARTTRPSALPVGRQRERALPVVTGDLSVALESAISARAST